MPVDSNGRHSSDLPTETGLTRRQLAIGATATGLALTTSVAAAPVSSQVLRDRQVVSQGFQTGRFGQVHYRYIQPAKASAKLPLLCLHASPVSSLAYTDFLPIIGTDRLAIAADTPGYGLSDRTPTPPTISDFAAAMGDLLDGMGLKQIDLLGNHTSSATAIELARQRPGLIRRIVVNSAMMFTPQDRIDYRAKQARLLIPDLDAAAALLPERWAQFRKIKTEWSEERAWQLFLEMYRNPTRMGWGYAASFDYDFAKTLMMIRHPMLILNSHDELYEITARARGVLPNVRVLDVPWGEGTFGKHGAEVAVLMRAFLDN